LPTISIPIYTIVQDGISIPITLDYHARGVRVDEVASNVGLGWALNGVGIPTIYQEDFLEKANLFLESIKSRNGDEISKLLGSTGNCPYAPHKS